MLAYVRVESAVERVATLRIFCLSCSHPALSQVCSVGDTTYRNYLLFWESVAVAQLLTIESFRSMWKYQLRVLAVVTLISLVLATSLNFWEGDVKGNIAAMKAGQYNPYREFNEWLNNLLFSFIGLSWLDGYVYEQLGGHESAY